MCQGRQLRRIGGPSWSLFMGEVRTTDGCGDAEGKSPWKKIILPLVPEVVPGLNGECVSRIAYCNNMSTSGSFHSAPV